MIAVTTVTAPSVPATHEEPPVQASGVVHDVEWVSIAVTLAPRAHVEIALVAPEGTLDDLPIGAGVRVYDDASGADRASTTVVDTRGFNMGWYSSGHHDEDERHGHWWHRPNGTGQEVAVAFNNAGKTPLDVRAMMWLTSSGGPREWVVKSDKPVEVVNVTHGPHALLHLEDEFETWVEPDVPAANAATSLAFMQYERAALNVTFEHEWHGDFMAWQYPRTCVDVEGVQLPVCTPVNPRLPTGVMSKRDVHGPPGGGARDGPAGDYSFQHTWYRYYPYECAGPVCAGERADSWWFQPLALTGVDAPLAAFE